MMLRLLPLLLLLPLAALANDTKEIGRVDTNLRNLGLTRSDQVVVERFDDPKIPGISCYIAQARTGGVSGMAGLAEDPARFALSCIATGPIQVTDALRKSPKGERVFETSSSFFFKETKVQRFLDEERSVVVYLAWSSKLIEGSPYSSLAAVPIR